ncbi:fumarate reductase/succinate dehydrogenase-like protein [Thermacetogenium phaeum DSM 12270]|uniref:Fumarate reductase/succinate dehydrogenase-like protein n=1 Tax=Thermacetogenium phaeum (strain ATCC BAA-254 / DSM 26808 / PB) TaxID=1089553 RepID=K4LRJ9_THEPS|nr:FAD-dependent oxidoreductase [Thermacetogenium phaeum]AFV10719.1 fumarate reductase/succinate dehydrogenase-like protein [Thermacetogenium phaeum DSM 12270]
MYNIEWPYPVEWGKENRIKADVLVIGGGIAGCMAAIAAARKRLKVVLVEKGASKRSGSAGSGCDHWENAATNPCCKITPEELTAAMIDDNDGYNNGISHYIECREGYDRLLDLEKMGAKIRDTDDEFKGAEFRDEKTKLLFAYDYENRYTLRVWGTTFKPAMYKEMRRLGVQVFDRIMATSLLTENGKQGSRVIGATGINTRTGKFLVFQAKATVICTSRPARVWLFSAGLPGLCEFRPPQCIGDGHAMGWRAGVEFTMMEKSVRAEFSAAGRSYPPYGAGNNHNTWYAATLVDAEGREIPYVDRDGNILTSVSQRYHPARGQKFFLMGGAIDNPKYEYRGPEILRWEELLKQGYKLPFFADLGSMPEMERKAIWGLMVGQEGKTQVPIYGLYTEAGFDPKLDMLQCYGTGWTSAQFLPQERQLFGLPGGILNDWELKTNLEGLYAAGDALFASDCVGHAAATGYYAGRHAANYAMKVEELPICEQQVEIEKQRVYAPLKNSDQNGIGWKELNMGIAKTMQNYCGGVKREELLNIGLKTLKDYEQNVIPMLYARNPHELVRTLEVVNILTVAQIIIHASLARKSSSRALCFERADYPEMDPPRDRKFITVKQVNNEVIIGELPLDYYGSLAENYEKYNKDYIRGENYE